MRHDALDSATSQNYKWSVLLCMLAALCEGIDLQAAGVAAAGIRQQYHAESQWLSFFFSASTFGLFFGAILGGRIADRVGRKPVLVASIALFGLFSLLTPLAWDMPSLTVARLLTGLGLGGALPNLIAIGSENAPDNRRSAYVTIIYAGTPFGGALASLVSLVTAAAHWRWIFILGGVVPLLVAPVVGRWLQESRAFRGAVTADARQQLQRSGLLAFMEEGRALRTLLLWVSFFLALLTLYLLLNWLPTLLASSGLSRAQVGLGMIGFNIGGFLAGLYIGFHLETEIRHRGVLLTFVGLPVLLVSLAMGGSQPLPAALIVFALGAAVVSAQAILYAFAPLCYPTRMRGTGVGFAVAIGRIGSIVGPLLGGVLIGSGRAPSQVITALLPIALVGCLCAIVLTWRKPPVQPS